MTPIVTIRPAPGSEATVSTGDQYGLKVHAFPMFAIRPVEWSCDPTGFDGLLLGSANAVRHGGEKLGDVRHLPAHCVGAMTAFAAKEAGFAVASTGAGGLQNVLDALPAPQRLLRLSGLDHVPLEPPEGIEIETCVAYESAALPMPDTLAELAAEGPLVLLHSAIAAGHFAQECDRLGIDRTGISLASLGPRIKAAAGPGWRRSENAPQPSDAALLALARDMCH